MWIYYRIKRYIKEKRFDKRMARQRYKKGYADCDCWGLHYWFSTTFPKMVLSLRDMKHGYPSADKFEIVDTFPIEWVEEASKEINKMLIKDGYEEFDIYDNFCRWLLILTRISWCFKMTDEELYDNDDYLKEFKMQNSFKDEGFELLKMYFWNLWD